MTARPVPRLAEVHAMYAVMTSESLGSDDLIPPPSPDLLRRYGTSDESLRRLASRHHQTLVHRTSSVDDAAFAHRDTRVEALALAHNHDGVVIDLGIPRVVEEQASDVSLSHATQWYVVDYADLSNGALSTVGLAAFGLPELLLTDVDQQAHAMAGAVLAGLVHRLIAEWPANDPVGRASVTLRDIAYGLGDAQAQQTPRDRSVGVDVIYEPERQLLVVRMLDDPAATLFAP